MTTTNNYEVSGQNSNDRGATPLREQSRLVGADYAAAGTSSRSVRTTLITEEDFELMLEVDIAVIGWITKHTRE